MKSYVGVADLDPVFDNAVLPMDEGVQETVVEDTFMGDGVEDPTIRKIMEEDGDWTF